jgi:hypothetical protein
MEELYYNSMGKAEAEYALLAKGEYTLEVVGWKIETAKDSDVRKIALQMEIVKSNDVSHAGRVVYDRLWLTDNAAWRIDQFRAALGEELQQGGCHLDPDKWVGKRVDCLVGVKAGRDGKDYQTFKYLPPLDPAPQPQRSAPRARPAQPQPARGAMPSQPTRGAAADLSDTDEGDIPF